MNKAYYLLFLIPICSILFYYGGWESIIFFPIGGAILIVTTIIMANYLKMKNASSGTILTTASVIFFSFLSIRINLEVSTDGPTLYWLGHFISYITNGRINILINESSLFSVLQYLYLLSLISLIIILIFIRIKVKENENGELSKNQHIIFNIIPILIVLIHIIILIPNITIAFCGNNYISPRNNTCPYFSELQDAVYAKYNPQDKVGRRYSDKIIYHYRDKEGLRSLYLLEDCRFSRFCILTGGRES